jgi:hypothetical protein
MGVLPPEDAGPFDPVPVNGRVTVRMLVRSAWHDAPPVLRSLARGVWIVAVVAAAGLIAVDFAGGWDHLPMVSNLLSEIVSALAFFPIALLIVSRLAAYQVEEADRPRLQARVDASRTLLQEALGRLVSLLDELDEDGADAANGLAAAVDGDEAAGPAPATDAAAELHQINQMAWAMYRVMDDGASDLFYRRVGLVRDYGNQLRAALDEQRQAGRLTGDTRELTELLGNLEVVVAGHRRLMSQNQQVFGHRPALAPDERHRGEELRDMAVTYLKTVTRIHDVCIELQQYIQRTDGPAEITR